VSVRPDPRDPVGAVGAALARQREALARRDLAALQSSADDLERALAALSARAPSRAALRALRDAATVNGDLLARAGAANARALGVLFEAPVTYGPAGASGLARNSRALDAA